MIMKKKKPYNDKVLFTTMRPRSTAVVKAELLLAVS